MKHDTHSSSALEIKLADILRRYGNEMEEFNEDDSHSRYGRINAEFLNAIDPESRHRIVALIANHYGISVPEILTEVTDVAAEDILDYMAGNDRLATSLLKQRHGLK